MTGFVDSITSFFRNALDFKGKSDVTDYLWPAAAIVAMSILLTLTFGDGFLVGLFQLLIILPLASLSVRRLRDAGRSLWWLLVLLIPGLGWLIYIILMLLPSE